MDNKNKEKSQFVTSLYVVEFTADRIENDKNLLPSLLKIVSMFKIKFWWNTREDEIKHT